MSGRVPGGAVAELQERGVGEGDEVVAVLKNSLDQCLDIGGHAGAAAVNEAVGIPERRAAAGSGRN